MANQSTDTERYEDKTQAEILGEHEIAIRDLLKRLAAIESERDNTVKYGRRKGDVKV